MTFKIFCTIAEYILIFGAVLMACAVLAVELDDYSR